MTTPARPNIGEIACPYCPADAKRAFVRKNKNGKLFMHCNVHGTRLGDNKPSQDWILEHATFYSPDAIAPAPEPKPKPKPAPEPAPAKKGGGIFDDVFGD